MMGSIGMTTGLVGYCLYLVSRVLYSQTKVKHSCNGRAVKQQQLLPLAAAACLAGRRAGRQASPDGKSGTWAALGVSAACSCWFDSVTACR